MIDTPIDPAGLVSGDWNGDGHQDVVYIESSANPTLHVLLGNGKGQFINGASLKLPPGTCTGYSLTGCWMFVGDFDHDGNPDILTAGIFSYQPGFVVIPGQGDGTFGTPIVTTFTLQNLDSFVIHQVTVADFNGDGQVDILVPSYYTNTLTLYLGDGTGSFKVGKGWNLMGPTAAYAVDVNHDGNMDAIVFAGAYGYFYTRAVSVWLGDGSGNLTLSQSYPDSNSPLLPVRVTDLNGDGELDIIGYDQSGNVQVMLGQHDGTFSAPTTILSAPFGTYPQSRSLTLTDVNGDGIPDMIHPSSIGIDIIVGQAGFTFGSPQPQTFGSLLTDPVTADFDEDGTMDAVFGVQGGIQFFFGKHQSAFSDPTIHHTPAPVTFLFAGDFNHDGIADVVALDASGNIETFPGTSNGQFGARVQTVANLTDGGYEGAPGDFDGDGKLDIYLAQSPGKVLYGNGDGSFSLVSVPSLPFGLIADLNKDGRSDVVSMAPYGSLGTQYGLIAMLGNAGRGFSTVSTQFPDVGGLTGIVTPALIALGDVDGDGKPDAVVFNPNKPALEAWLGNGDGTFHLGNSTNITTSGLSALGTGGSGNSYGTGFIADLDGDGNQDLVFLATLSAPANSATPAYVIVVVYGDGKGSFTAPEVVALSHNYTNLVPATLYAGARPSFVVSSGRLIGVIRNLGGRQYSGEEFYTAGFFLNAIVADFTGDGLGDILVNRANPMQFPAQSTGSFTVLLNKSLANGNASGAINGQLSVNPATVSYNQAFAITATLQGPNLGDPVPTGSVTFNVAGQHLGTVALQNGVAVLQVSGSATQTLPPGQLVTIGNYSGDLNYGSAETVALLNVLEPVYATSTTLTAEVDGQPVSSIQAGSFVYLLAHISALQPVNTGTVSFYDGTTVIGQTTIAAGQATFGTNLLTIGPHMLTAKYLGVTPAASASFQPSTSGPAALTVTANSTTATLTPSATSVIAGSVLTLRATVSSTIGNPIGAITFYDGTQVLIILSLDATGTAAFSTASLATGTHSLSARYTANASYAGSVTNSATVTVNGAQPTQQATVTVISGLEPRSGEGGQLLVKVMSQSSDGAISGNVSLIIDGKLAGSGTLSQNGTVLLPLAIIDPSLHVIQASYAGTISAAPSVSDPFRTTMYLNDQDFTLSAGPVAQSTKGSRAVLTVGSAGSWTKAVTLSCPGPSPVYNCNISPSTITGKGTALLILQTSDGSRLAIALLLPFGLLFCGKRRRLVMGMLLLTLLLLFSVSCGTSTRVISSVVTVEARSGSLTHSTQIVIKTERRVSQ